MSWALPRAPFANAIITMGAAPGPNDWFSQLPSFYTNKPTILGVPVGQLALLDASPPRPCWFNSIVFHASVTVLLLFHGPTRSTGSADPRWPAATAADPEKRTAWHTTFLTVRDPAALLVRSPGKPCPTAFITVAASRGASRASWSQPPSPTTGSAPCPDNRFSPFPSLLHQ